MLEAQARGHSLFVYEVGSMALDEGVHEARGATRTDVTALMRPVTVRREKGRHATFGDAERRSLRTMDVVLMRQDPPFDMAYITATHMLDHIHGVGPDRALVVNDPRWVRDSRKNCWSRIFPS